MQGCMAALRTAGVATAVRTHTTARAGDACRLDRGYQRPNGIAEDMAAR